MEEHKNAVEIAVLKEQITGLREQAKSHAESTKDEFTKINAKVDEIITLMNKGKGAYAASLMFAGVVGSAVMAGVTWFLGKIGS